MVGLAKAQHWTALLRDLSQHLARQRAKLHPQLLWGFAVLDHAPSKLLNAISVPHLGSLLPSRHFQLDAGPPLSEGATMWLCAGISKMSTKNLILCLWSLAVMNKASVNAMSHVSRMYQVPAGLP